MFSWWKKRKQAKNAPKFMGVRTDINHYLGYSRITYHDGDKETDWCLIHFFVDKNDHTKRQFAYDARNKSKFYDHSWMINAQLWKLNEKDLYKPIVTLPSKWLRQYMLEEYDSIWCDEKKWWIQNVEDKIESKQYNVITVKFKE